ncbi:MAG: REP-associated tyrosine transposase [Janthinobacterium lividum]
MSSPNLTHYQRNLPHWLPAGETLFITFRLAGSLPAAVLDKLRAELENMPKTADPAERYARQKRYFGRFDEQLDAAQAGPVWLKQPAIVGLVAQALHQADKQTYTLQCYCIMANHVHLVVSLDDNAPSLTRTLQGIKSYTAYNANKLLQRTGQFWQRESYDHIVRDAAELERVIAYVLENPVKAGLVDDWQKWPYTYWAQ